MVYGRRKTLWLEDMHRDLFPYPSQCDQKFHIESWLPFKGLSDLWHVLRTHLAPLPPQPQHYTGRLGNIYLLSQILLFQESFNDLFNKYLLNNYVLHLKETSG